MNSTEPSYFSPPFPEADHPLSIRGRFGRLSFIAWSAFYSLFSYAAVLR